MSAAKSEEMLENLRDRFHLRNPRLVNIISEFYATAFLLFIGIGIVFQFILTHEKLNTWIHINLGWGFALTLCVFMTSKTSGGHMNPAVSFLMFTLKHLSFVDFIFYSIAQTAGAFVGAGMAYVVYYDQLQHFAGDIRAVTGPNATSILFCSYPAAHVSNLGAFVDQVAGTGILTTFVAAIIDKRNNVPHHLHPILFGFILIMIGTAYGMNLGYPINPARDLGPRILSYFLGYGSEVFTYHGYYFWIPIVAPFFGSVLGAWIYFFVVGFQIQEKKEPIRLQVEKDLDNLNGA
ncbi:hypothetical protein FO519_008899 [Halicephalobus sp. NKZ332]|nr:hypothetical protein FO519_008899 [Halicephalobus sp. NKZ332]